MVTAEEHLLTAELNMYGIQPCIFIPEVNATAIFGTGVERNIVMKREFTFMQRMVDQQDSAPRDGRAELALIMLHRLELEMRGYMALAYGHVYTHGPTDLQNVAVPIWYPTA